MLMPKLLGLGEKTPLTDCLMEAAGERFDHFVLDFQPDGSLHHQAISDRVLTAQNFLAQTRAILWQHVRELKGIRRSYLELRVWNRQEFLRVLRESEFIVNREPFWSIHRFDSARAVTDYSHQPSLHFANDRADEDAYGPEYFFVHWDRTSAWFRRSHWPIRRLPGARQAEQLYAAARHRFGCACPQQVCEYLNIS
ncbi:MAG TPA: hypothetical protein PLD20_20655 [Blastocatellia bacterium]|nr:hypothetical protein [Blastocatellia bacterium]HMZ20359.1 hypothetical protein [Blastocatellia bacterium]HNG32052.1 hypothetical protein [Blastocatellia bacterium]